MAKYLNDIDYIEQELAELRSHLSQTFKIVDGLAKIQTKFEDFEQTDQQLDSVKANKAEVTDLQVTFDNRFVKIAEVIESKSVDNESKIVNLEATVSDRFAQIAEVIEFKLAEIDSEIFKIKHELNYTNANLNDQLSKQVSDLKIEVEEKLTAIQAPLSGIETKLRTELETSINQLSAAGVNNQNQESLEHQLQIVTSFFNDLERQVNKMERQLRNMEKQQRVMSNWLVVSVLTTVLALALGLGLGILNLRI